MLSVAVVEDDLGYSKLLQRYLGQYSKETGEQFKVAAFSDGAAFLSDGGTYHIVFMDIEMPIMDGMRTAKKLRAIDTNASLIFVTNMAKYAVEGYAVDAMDFIIKPVDYFVFSLKLEKAIRIQKRLMNDVVYLNTLQGTVKIKTADILYIESNLHFITYHTDHGEMQERASMKETEKRFLEKGFVRCNNSFLINLARVDRTDGNMVKIGENEIVVSRSRKKQFLDAFSVYYRGL